MAVAGEVPSAQTAKATNAAPDPKLRNSLDDKSPEESGSLKDASSKEGNDAKEEQATKPDRGFRFWAIIGTLCVIGLLSSLENTVVTTSLPYIVQELDLGENYIWITNVFFLTR